MMQLKTLYVAVGQCCQCPAKLTQWWLRGLCATKNDKIWVLVHSRLFTKIRVLDKNNYFVIFRIQFSSAVRSSGILPALLRRCSEPLEKYPKPWGKEDRETSCLFGLDLYERYFYTHMAHQHTHGNLLQ